MRQAFFSGYKLQSLAELDKLFSDKENYRAMPAKVSQLILKQVVDSWKAYKLANESY